MCLYEVPILGTYVPPRGAEAGERDDIAGGKDA